MARAMTKQELEAWRQRWRLVEEAQLREVQTASLEDKLHQFEVLRGWARQMDWAESLRRGDDEVRQRWNRLQAAHHGG